MFCLRERELDPAEQLDEIERVPVAHLAPIGRKLTVALDRPHRKRGEFLVVRKERVDGGGAYRGSSRRAPRRADVRDSS